MMCFWMVGDAASHAIRKCLPMLSAFGDFGAGGVDGAYSHYIDNVAKCNKPQVSSSIGWHSTLCDIDWMSAAAQEFIGNIADPP